MQWRFEGGSPLATEPLVAWTPPGREHRVTVYAAGAKAIFPPGTVIADAAKDLLEKLAAQLGHERDAAE